MSWIATRTRSAPNPMPSHAHNDMGASLSVAGPETDRPRVHVDEAAFEIDTHTAELLRLRPCFELYRRASRHLEVDRVAVRVLAVACDLMTFLTKNQVVLGVAKP